MLCLLPTIRLGTVQTEVECARDTRQSGKDPTVCQDMQTSSHTLAPYERSPKILFRHKMTSIADIRNVIFPYIKTFWYDQSGHLRWSMSFNSSLFLMALLSILLSYALGRFLYSFYVVCHVFILHKKNETLIDDQTSVIATNTETPSALIAFLIHLAWRQRKKALMSPVWWTVFGRPIGFGFWCLQVATIITLSFLFLSDPIPNTLGTCGSPKYPSSNSMLLSFTKPQFSRLFNQASMRYANGVDDGKSVTCPGPIGHKFSWQVVASEPSYCWFGPRFCFEGSRTITQQATVVPRDMGRIRESQMSMTVMMECSHLNTEFVKVGYK